MLLNRNIHSSHLVMRIAFSLVISVGLLLAVAEEGQAFSQPGNPGGLPQPAASSTPYAAPNNPDSLPQPAVSGTPNAVSGNLGGSTAPKPNNLNQGGQGQNSQGYQNYWGNASGLNTPNISITAVVKDTSVTISGVKFPTGQKLNVLIGAYGSYGVNGVLVGNQVTDEDGSFSATFAIPSQFSGAQMIAIRAETADHYYYGFNWFYNTTTD
jgi:hypothetical protein